MIESNVKYELWLTRLDIANNYKNRIVDCFGDAKKVYDASKSDLLSGGVIDDKIADIIVSSRDDELIDKTYQEFLSYNQGLITRPMVNYPDKLRVIRNSPYGLFYIDYAKLLSARWAELTGTAGLSILDVGTGGGFPGIPLAILLPGVSFTLCDSVGKKTLVASEVAKALGLENVQVVNARAESLPQTYPYVVSRAVASLDTFYPWVRGKFSRAILYLRGGDVAEETALLMGRFRLRAGSVGTWPVTRWLPDPYFDGKYLIDIRK